MPDKEKTSYRELMEYVHEMQSSADMLKEVVYNSMESDGFDMKSVEKFHENTSIDDIKVQPDDFVEEILMNLGDFSDNKIKSLCRDEFNKKKTSDFSEFSKISDQDGNPDYSKFDDEFEQVYDTEKFSLIRGVLIEAWNNINEVKRTYDEVDEIKQQANEGMDEYIKYLTSDEHLKDNEEKIENMRKKASEMEDGYEKKKLEKSIDAFKASLDLSFITKRIETVGESEIARIKDAFFDTRQSNYVVKRFNEKIEKLGYNKNIHSSLLNIEEKFLEEKYHVFNNLFIFHMMRYIGHINVNKNEDKVYASTLISYTGNLIYHKFTSTNLENKFVGIIRSFLDNFEPYREKFEKDNVLHPNHPVRLEKKKKREDEIKEMIYKNFEDNGYEVTDEVKELELDALRKLYDGYIDELEQNKEEKCSLSEIINKMKLNSESYEREKLKKQYLQYFEMTDEINAKFETDPIDSLKEFVKTIKKDHENKENASEESDEINEDSSDKKEDLDESNECSPEE